MKSTLSIYCGIAFLLCLCSQNAWASPVEISWSNPDKYRDLRAVNETKTAIRYRFFKEISHYMNELSQDLPHGYQLMMDVSQVDLAGNIEFVHGQQVRVVKDMFYPNMAFRYQLKNSQGQVVLADDVHIKGKNFLLSTKRRVGSEPFLYEKKMIADWFNRAVLKSPELQLN